MALKFKGIGAKDYKKLEGRSQQGAATTEDWTTI